MLLSGTNHQSLGQVATFIDSRRRILVDEVQCVERIRRLRNQFERVEYYDLVAEHLPPMFGCQLKILPLEVNDDRRLIAT